MTDRVVILIVALVLLAGGVGLFFWLTGVTLSAALDRLQMTWFALVKAIKDSTPAQRTMAVCGSLILVGMIILARTIRRV